LALTGCAAAERSAGLNPAGRSATPTRGAAPAAGQPITYPSHCAARDNGELPDPACTPGAINPDVTQATITSTICRSGYTKTIRPPQSYTAKVKGLAIAAYGDYAGAAFGKYELDHLVSLELGGAPRDVRNLWPEHPASTNPKDKVENAAHEAVCDGHLTLATAQRGIATNWIALGHQLGVTGIPRS